MGNREKMEIPTIEFTPVTLLTTASSTCSPEPSDGYECLEDEGAVTLGDKDKPCPDNFG